MAKIWRETPALVGSASRPCPVKNILGTLLMPLSSTSSFHEQLNRLNAHKTTHHMYSQQEPQPQAFQLEHNNRLTHTAD